MACASATYGSWSWPSIALRRNNAATYIGLDSTTRRIYYDYSKVILSLSMMDCTDSPCLHTYLLHVGLAGLRLRGRLDPIRPSSISITASIFCLVHLFIGVGAARHYIAFDIWLPVTEPNPYGSRGLPQAPGKSKLQHRIHYYFMIAKNGRDFGHIYFSFCGIIVNCSHHQ